jgi:hypothetical protein
MAVTNIVHALSSYDREKRMFTRCTKLSYFRYGHPNLHRYHLTRFTEITLQSSLRSQSFLKSIIQMTNARMCFIDELLNGSDTSIMSFTY